MDALQIDVISVLNGVALGVILYMVASGLAIIFGLMNVLNLAHGSAYMLGAYTSYALAGSTGNFGVSLLAGLAVGAMFGVVLRVSMLPISRGGHLEEAIVTLALAFIIKSIVSAIFGDAQYSVRPPAELSGTISVAGDAFPTYRLFIIAVGLCFAAAVYVVMRWTRIGAILNAVVHDEMMSRALGVNADRVRLIALIVGSAVASVTGVLNAPIMGVAPGLDDHVLLLALVVVVLGGRDSLPGVLVAALVIGQVQTSIAGAIPQAAGYLLFGAMALTLLLRPDGILSKKGGR